MQQLLSNQNDDCSWYTSCNGFKQTDALGYVSAESSVLLLAMCISRRHTKPFHNIGSSRGFSLRVPIITMVEYSPIPTPVYVSLWISLVCYGVVGLVYYFHQFIPTLNPPWLKGRWPIYMTQTWQSMTSVGLLLLGYVCVDGLVTGSVTTLEIEIELLAVSLYAGTVFKVSLPMPLTYIVPLTKPEVWLTVLLWVTCYDIVRLPALLLSVFFVGYGVAMAVLKPYFPYGDFAGFMEEVKAVDPETAEKMAKLGGCRRG